MLSRLAVHYYRPDFTEGQAKLLIEDLVSDLQDQSVHDIQMAIQKHRRDSTARFFPTSGQLLAHIKPGCTRFGTAAAQSVSGRPVAKEFGDSRPLDWEYQRKAWWKPGWHADDLKKANDVKRYGRYEAWRLRVKLGEIPGRNPNEY